MNRKNKNYQLKNKISRIVYINCVSIAYQLRSMSDSDSDSEWFKQNVAKKSTWKSRESVLSKGMMKWLYDALVQASNDKDRVAILRRMMDSPPEYETVYTNAITDAFKKFKKDECPPANYKTECYKEFKRVVNQFRDLFTDSGKPLRFTLKRRSSPRAASAEAVKKQVSPQRHSPVPLHSSYYNNILQMPNWKIKGFAKLISERSTDAEKRRFIQKYLHVTDKDGNTLSPSSDALLNDIVINILSSNDVEVIFADLLELKEENAYSEQYAYYIVYPFAEMMHPNVFRSGRRIPNVRLLGGGKRRPTKRRTKRKY